MSEKILNVDYESEMGQSYVDYSMSVITESALPDVREGLKTVQHPLARTGAYFHAAIKNGKFQGTI